MERKSARWIVGLLAVPLLALAGGSSPTGITCTTFDATGAQQCCKICTKGKACGDTCIAKDKVCHKGPGCACNG